MKDLDKFAIAALPLAFKFYKKAIENDGIKLEFEGDEEGDPSIDLKVVADYSYLMALAMHQAKTNLDHNKSEKDWVELHGEFIEKLIEGKK